MAVVQVMPQGWQPILQLAPQRYMRNGTLSSRITEMVIPAELFPPQQLQRELTQAQLLPQTPDLLQKQDSLLADGIPQQMAVEPRMPQEPQIIPQMAQQHFMRCGTQPLMHLILLLVQILVPQIQITSQLTKRQNLAQQISLQMQR
jgi:hypothetical protein